MQSINKLNGLTKRKLSGRDYLSKLVSQFNGTRELNTKVATFILIWEKSPELAIKLGRCVTLGPSVQEKIVNCFGEIVCESEDVDEKNEAARTLVSLNFPGVRALFELIVEQTKTHLSGKGFLNCPWLFVKPLDTYAVAVTALSFLFTCE
ncbi:hypothetical protein ACFL52_01075 [Candidatus Margulisiibacteriota bacterium]